MNDLCAIPFSVHLFGLTIDLGGDSVLIRFLGIENKAGCAEKQNGPPLQFSDPMIEKIIN